MMAVKDETTLTKQTAEKLSFKKQAKVVCQNRMERARKSKRERGRDAEYMTYICHSQKDSETIDIS